MRDATIKAYDPVALTEAKQVLEGSDALVIITE